jgi:hypothetical protein
MKEGIEIEVSCRSGTLKDMAPFYVIKQIVRGQSPFYPPYGNIIIAGLIGG